MSDIKILWEFAKSHSCCEELKAVNRLEKIILMYCIIDNRLAYLCGGKCSIKCMHGENLPTLRHEKRFKKCDILCTKQKWWTFLERVFRYEV